LKNVILEKENTIKRLEKSFSEKEGKAVMEYEEIINNQTDTIEVLGKTIKDQSKKITIYKEKFDEFLTSYPEAKNCWDSYIDGLNGVKIEQ